MSLRRRACGVGPAVALSAALLWAPHDARAAWNERALAGTAVHVYAPGQSSPVGSGRALMVVLHGCSQGAGPLRDAGNLEASGDAMGVVVAVPEVPGGGVIAGCWDYYGVAHERDSGHHGALFQIVEELLADPALQIDRDQVYVVGFSSGGGEAMVLGCLAPDVFAGVGVVASPAVGTDATDLSTAATTAEEAAMWCRAFALDRAPAFEHQVAFSFFDNDDLTVTPAYNSINVGMFAGVYAAGVDDFEEESIDLATLPGASPTGEGVLYRDADGVRIARLDSTSQLGHAWPSGSGTMDGGLSFINGDGLNLSRFAAEFFAAHNVRVRREPPSGTGSTGSGGSSTEGGDGITATMGSSGATTTGGPGTEGEPDPAGDQTDGGTAGDPDAGPAQSGSGCGVGGTQRVGGPAWALAALLLCRRRCSHRRKGQARRRGELRATV